MLPPEATGSVVIGSNVGLDPSGDPVESTSLGSGHGSSEACETLANERAGIRK